MSSNGFEMSTLNQTMNLTNNSYPSIPSKQFMSYLYNNNNNYLSIWF